MKANSIFYFIALAVSLGMSSCKDNLTAEISELHLSRSLSPTNVVAQVVERTNVRLNWKKSNNAVSYTIELFDNPAGTGNAVRRIEDITMSQLPYTIIGLDGETDYMVKIQAIGEGIEDSKWITTTFKTGTEQILMPVIPEEITASSVILRWPAGTIATHVILSPGDRTVDLSPTDINNGFIAIMGLVSDVTYTARLMNGEKTRGTMSFTTMLGDNVTKISPSDNLEHILSTLNDGDIVALEAGEYIVNADLDITKTITIQGYKPADRPVIKGLVMKIKNNAGLTLKDVILDGRGNPSQNQAFLYEEDKESPYGTLQVENSIIQNYVKGLLYMNKKTRATSVKFLNNIIFNIECNGGDFFDLRNGIIDEVVFRNNTVSNSSLARDFFRMDAGGSTNFSNVTSKIYIENNTFYKILDGANRRMLYIRLASHQIYFNKNILVESAGTHTNQASTTLTEMKQNNYYLAPNFTAGTGSGVKNDTGNFTTFNPEFQNAGQSNFTLGNLELKLNEIGPLRWR